MSKDTVIINGKEYPSLYHPGRGDPLMDDVWEIVDSLEGQTVSERSFLAGRIYGLVLRHRLKPSISNERVAEIAAIPDDKIDTSDIAEVPEEFFRNAKLRGEPSR